MVSKQDNTPDDKKQRARRPVFVPSFDGGLVSEHTVTFDWFPGFAETQKQKSIASFHCNAKKDLELNKILEVSSKSRCPMGRDLSALNLRIKMDGKPVLLEAAYQGSKVFEFHGKPPGPFPHLYEWTDGRKVKSFMRKYLNDRLLKFDFDGEEWQLEPKTAFYDWLYLNALRELANTDDDIGDNLNEKLRSFDAFTDIEFNPKKSINCQARSCALYVALEKRGELDIALEDRDAFIDLIEEHKYPVISDDNHQNPPSQNQLPY